MKMFIRNIKVILLLFMCISVALLVGLAFQQYRSRHELNTAAGENKDALRTRYAQAGIIFDSDGLVLASSNNGERTYCEDPDVAVSVLHVVGDYTHNIENTVEGNYQSVLLGNDRNLLRQAVLDIFGKGLYGDDITLTVNGKLSAYAYSLLDNRKGSVVILNYNTGDILASVSSPSVDPSSVIKYENIPDTALFNRALMASYAPGSTFKVVTATAFIQSPNYDPNFTVNCDGQSTVDPFGAAETGDGHGQIGIEDAIARSCNVFWGAAGVLTGPEELLATAHTMGFGQMIPVDRLAASGGEISIPDNRSTLSWVSIGQPVADSILYTSPLHLAMIAGAIGNGGDMMAPHVVSYITTPLGEKYSVSKPEVFLHALSPETASMLEGMMIKTTEYGTGTSAGIDGYTVAAKTGTVQVTGQKNNALCIAYITDDKAPLAICVVVEEGGAGGDTAAPIAGKVLKKATDLMTAS